MTHPEINLRGEIDLENPFLDAEKRRKMMISSFHLRKSAFTWRRSATVQGSASYLRFGGNHIYDL
jgi:hypothetical protein